MNDRYRIILIVEDKHRHEVVGQMAVDSDEFPIFAERFVEDVRAPVDAGFSILSFDTVVEAMKKREFRREYLLHAAKKLAARLADYIEDKEGWHGDRRRETIREMEKR